MALAERTAEVVWNGTLASGEGKMTAGGGAMKDLPIDWASRSDRAEGTSSPEELLAAADASCYAMALSLTLTREGNKPETIDVKAKCSLEEQGDWYRVSAIDLEVRATVPGMSEEDFQRAARDADAQCPVSKALRGDVEIRLDASLV
jgi:osmotically inducible protein OsmC